MKQNVHKGILVCIIVLVSFAITPRASASWFCFQPDSKPPLGIFKYIRLWVGPYFVKYPCTSAELEATKAEQEVQAEGLTTKAKGWFEGVKRAGSAFATILEKLSK